MVVLKIIGMKVHVENMPGGCEYYETDTGRPAWPDVGIINAANMREAPKRSINLIGKIVPASNA
jgi:hypothetical protein